MFGILDIFWLLGLLSTIAMTLLTREPSGPEGALGIWVPLLIPCIFLAILVFMMVAKGSFDSILGGGFLQFVLALGILIAFSIGTFSMIDRDDSLIQRLALAVPYLILAGCAVIIHHADFPHLKLVHLVAAILLGSAALTGWGLAGTGVFLAIQKELKRDAQQAQEERAWLDERKQWEAAEYAKLDDSASLYALLQFVWARNDQVQQHARERVIRFPGLVEKLIDLIEKDCKEAISYVAKEYKNPPIKFAPPWGRMLKRQLKKWDSLQYDEYAGTWEQNLIEYFEGARKIQLSGGYLDSELRAWYRHLQKCKGLGGLAAFVKSLLKVQSKS